MSEILNPSENFTGVGYNVDVLNYSPSFEEGTSFDVKVTLTNIPSDEYTVILGPETVFGDPLSGDDLSIPVVEFAAGEYEKIVTIQVNDDGVVEGPEPGFLTVLSAKDSNGGNVFFSSGGGPGIKVIDPVDPTEGSDNPVTAPQPTPAPSGGGGGGSTGNNNDVTDNSNGIDSIENTIVNGRQYITNKVDSLTGAKDFSIGLLDGDDFLEVVGGNNNFANGNSGADNIVVRGGQGRYLGGADNDRLEVTGAGAGTWVNGNRGEDVVTGSVDGVTYRGGSENDILQVSAGTVWGDLGADTFQAMAGQGVAIVQDYTAGEDVVQGIAGGSFTGTADGLVYGVGSDQMLLFAGITDASQVTVV